MEWLIIAAALVAVALADDDQTGGPGQGYPRPPCLRPVTTDHDDGSDSTDGGGDR
jgi:hypothetical protein